MELRTKKMSLLINYIADELKAQEAAMAQENAPIHAISPAILKKLCISAGLNVEEAYFLAIIATAIVRGMLQPGRYNGNCRRLQKWRFRRFFDCCVCRYEY